LHLKQSGKPMPKTRHYEQLRLFDDQPEIIRNEIVALEQRLSVARRALFARHAQLQKDYDFSIDKLEEHEDRIKVLESLIVNDIRRDM